MQRLIHISACRSGVVHLSIGAVTVRVDQEILHLLADEISRYVQVSEAVPQKPVRPISIVTQIP